MTPKQLRLLLFALVGAVVLWGILVVVRRPPQDRLVALALPDVDIAAINAILVTEGDDSALVIRESGAPHGWTTNGYAPDTNTIQQFLSGLADEGLSTELAGQNPASHAEFGVTDDARRVQVYVSGERRLDLIAGGRTADYVGIFVRRTGEDTVYALRGRLAETLRRSIDEWRDKRIVSIEPDSVGSIEIRRGSSVVIARRDGPESKSWILSSGRPVDVSTIDLMLSEHNPLMAAGFATHAQAQELNFDPPRARTRFVSHGGMELAELVFDSTATAMWARTGAGPTVFRVNPWMWTRLVPTL